MSIIVNVDVMMAKRKMSKLCIFALGNEYE